MGYVSFKRYFWGALLALLTLAPAAPSQAATLSDGVTDLLNLLPLQPQRFIVQTQGRPTAGLLNLVTLLGGQVYAVFDTVDGFAIRMPLGVVGVLLARLDILHISLDEPVYGSMDIAAEATGVAVVRDKSQLDGAGIGVAVLDTGVSRHPDLITPTDRLVGWKDLVGDRKTPYDDSGHGTHVAGVIAGSGYAAAANGKELRGVAPKAHIIPIKILDGQMRGYTSNAIKGLDYCVENAQKYNIRVANLSLGQPVRESYKLDPLCKAVAKANRCGIAIVVSAGNLGRKQARSATSGVRYGTITAPGNEPLAITVGATRSNHTGAEKDDEMASYSSRGPSAIDHVSKPDLVAPGNRILSLGTDGALSRAYSGDVSILGGARYQQMSGTSVAAPVVAGTIALMLQAEPSLSPDSVKVRLMQTARKTWSAASANYRPYDRGAGLLDVRSALQSKARAVWAARSPVVERAQGTGRIFARKTGALRAETAGASLADYQDYPGFDSYKDELEPVRHDQFPSPAKGSLSLPFNYQPTPDYPDEDANAFDFYAPTKGVAPGQKDKADDAQILWGEPTLWADSFHWSNRPDGRTESLSNEQASDP